MSFGDRKHQETAPNWPKATGFGLTVKLRLILVISKEKTDSNSLQMKRISRHRRRVRCISLRQFVPAPDSLSRSCSWHALLSADHVLFRCSIPCKPGLEGAGSSHCPSLVTLEDRDALSLLRNIDGGEAGCFVAVTFAFSQNLDILFRHLKLLGSINPPASSSQQLRR